EQLGQGDLALSAYSNRKISTTIGLRAEYTNYRLQLAKENLESTNHYWNLLPSFSVNFNISKNYISAFHFNSGIRRPSYNLLTPNVIYASDKFYYTGNPWLKPAKIWCVEYFNILFTKFSISTYWEYTQDLYSSVLIDKGNEVTESSYQNCFDNWQTELKFNSSLNFMENRLNMYFHLEWTWGKYLNLKENFTLPRKIQNNLLTAMTFDYYITKNYRLKTYGFIKYSIIEKNYQIDTKPYFNIEIGVRYKCLANRSLYVSLYGTDIFNLFRNKQTIHYDQNIRYFEQKYSYQGLTISLSYSFKGGKDLKRGEVDEDVNAENYRFDK
ncbi:MAG: outer membrane beta-barrel family protein, partial [Odoribacter sp.]|nr:outer membrane beta-barrel family protein [Odoribacter sp.]